MEPIAQYGDIAICQKGYTGLIIDIEDEIAFGFHLNRLKIGQKWQSKNPKIIGNIYEYLNSLEEKKLTIK